MGLEGILADRVASRLVPVIGGKPEPVGGQVVPSLVDGQAVQDDDVPARVVAADPGGIVLYGYLPPTGTHAFSRLQHAVPVRTPVDGESAEFFRTVAQGHPGRPRLVRTPDEVVVLVRRGRVRVQVGEHEPADVPAVRKRRFAEQHFKHAGQRGIERQRVEVANAQDIVVETLPSRVVAFEHAGIRMRDAVHGIRTGRKPSAFPADFENLPPDVVDARGVEQTAEEQAAVLRGAPAQFTGLREQIRRVFQRVDLLHVYHGHIVILSWTCLAGLYNHLAFYAIGFPRTILGGMSLKPVIYTAYFTM